MTKPLQSALAKLAAVQNDDVMPVLYPAEAKAVLTERDDLLSKAKCFDMICEAVASLGDVPQTSDADKDTTEAFIVAYSKIRDERDGLREQVRHWEGEVEAYASEVERLDEQVRVLREALEWYESQANGQAAARALAATAPKEAKPHPFMSPNALDGILYPKEADDA